MIKESLLAAAMSFPAWHGDVETEEERAARLDVIVTAIDQATAIATCQEPSNAYPIAKKADTERARSDSDSEQDSEEKNREIAKKDAPAEAQEGEDPPASSSKKDGQAPDSEKSEARRKESEGHEGPHPGNGPDTPPADNAQPASFGEWQAGTYLSNTNHQEAPLAAGDATEDSSQEKKKCKRIWRGSRRELSFLLLGQAFMETRLAKHVHEGKCRAALGECDSGKAISLWQLQYGGHLPKERWAQLAGTGLDATRRAALEAATALSRGYNYCHSVTGAVSLYATGQHCNWKPAQKRVKFYKELQSRH
ncbi:MAG: hypothetical protein MK135_17325 [Polyangiaceae bacterium]|nr:hypothetical protein [Polyangiaceae bacterium]